MRGRAVLVRSMCALRRTFALQLTHEEESRQTKLDCITIAVDACTLAVVYVHGYLGLEICA